MNVVLTEIQQIPGDPLVRIRPPLHSHSCYLGNTHKIKLYPLVVVVIPSAPGLRMVQSCAPSGEAWIRRRSCDLVVLKPSILETKRAITVSSYEDYKCKKR